MPWKRGIKTIPVEVSRIQDWVETHDLIFNGPNGDNGMIRIFYDDKAEERQRDKTRRRDLKILTVVLSILTVVIAALALLEANHQIHDHTLVIPSVSQRESQVASELAK